VLRFFSEELLRRSNYRNDEVRESFFSVDIYIGIAVYELIDYIPTNNIVCFVKAKFTLFEKKNL